MPATVVTSVHRSMNGGKNLQMNFCNEVNELQQVCFLEIIGKSITRIFFTVQFLQNAGYFFILHVVQRVERIAHGVEQAVEADVS